MSKTARIAALAAILAMSACKRVAVSTIDLEDERRQGWSSPAQDPSQRVQDVRPPEHPGPKNRIKTKKRIWKIESDYFYIFGMAAASMIAVFGPFVVFFWRVNAKMDAILAACHRIEMREFSPKDGG